MLTILIKKHAGITLTELLIVLLIIILLAAASGPMFYSIIQLQKLKNCAHKMMSDIKYIRASAQNNGTRGIFQLTSTESSQDLDGDGINEYYIAFLDKNLNGYYDSNDTVEIHGSQGDSLCPNNIKIDSGTSIRKIIFDPLGFLKMGASNRNIFITTGGQAIRIEITSITGLLRYYLNRDNCGNDGCSKLDEWTELTN